MRHLVLTGSVAILLVACSSSGGGDGGGDGDGLTFDNQPPIASFVADPSVGVTPLEVTLDASASADPDGSIVRFTWEFADGTVLNGAQVTYTFVDTGNHAVRLTVTDNDNVTDSQTTTIEVRPRIQVTQYSMTPIPSLLWPEFSWVYVSAINNNGQVTGQSGNHAFLYTDGTSVDLDTLGTNGSFGMDVNDAGAVVGAFSTADGGLQAFHHGGGVMTRLGTLDYSSSEAVSINEAGDIVGAVGDVAETDGAGFRTYWEAVKAFLYTDGVMRELGTLGGEWSGAVAISDGGQIVGAAETSDGLTHAFLYENGAMQDLGTLGGDYSGAIDINNRGQVVGLSEIRYETGYILEVCFIYSDGVMKAIESPLGGTVSPRAINNMGQVVGLEYDDDLDSFPFIWDEANGIRYLNEMLDPASDCRVDYVADINDLGEILVGAECGVDLEEGFGFVLTPVR